MEEREHFSCSVNPCAGREVQVGAIARKITKPQRVLVIGGGPGGMTAAVTASKRGHIVTLAEQDDHLGGLLRLADLRPIKRGSAKLSGLPDSVRPPVRDLCQNGDADYT